MTLQWLSAFRSETTRGPIQQCNKYKNSCLAYSTKEISSTFTVQMKSLHSRDNWPYVISYINLHFFFKLFQMTWLYWVILTSYLNFSFPLPIGLTWLINKEDEYLTNATPHSLHLALASQWAHSHHSFARVHTVKSCVNYLVCAVSGISHAQTLMCGEISCFLICSFYQLPVLLWNLLCAVCRSLAKDRWVQVVNCSRKVNASARSLSLEQNKVLDSH